MLVRGKHSYITDVESFIAFIVVGNIS